MLWSHLRAGYFGPKAQAFFQPRASPWEANLKELRQTAQRANSFARAKNNWPVGPLNDIAKELESAVTITQGVALG